MKKVIALIILFCLYVIYSGWVYTYGTSVDIPMAPIAQEGKQLWQSNNCQSCHQLYGLGGFMGPDLTNVTTDKKRGALYAKAILLNGGSKMPNFHFTEKEATNIIAYLSYIDSTSVSIK